VPVTLVAHAPLALQTLKDYIPVQGTGADDRLKLAINGAAGIIEQRIGGRMLCTRDTAITDYFSPLPNMCELYLGDWPVFEVVSVHESTDVPRVYDATTLLVEGTDFEVVNPRGIIRRLSDGAGSRTTWASAHHSVKVAYKAGYKTGAGTPTAAAALPDEFVQAALFIATAIYKESDRGAWGVSAQSDAMGNVTRFMGYVPPSIRELVDQHRRYEFDDIRERLS